MNKFKYQKKTNTSDESINSFRNFDKVLGKHEAISGAYKSIWKYIFIATGAAGISTTAFFLYPEHAENNLSKKISQITVQESPKVIVPVQHNEKPKKEIVQVSDYNNNTKKSTSVNPENKKKSIIEGKIKKVSISEPKVLEKEIAPEKWFTLNEKPEKEIIKLPTLFVSNVAWPKKIEKTVLIKSPNIMAFYQSINQETPIVNGTAYITTENATEKPIGYKLSNSTFPPGLIREIHKTKSSSILLLKNIVLHIPGRGRVNIGDRKIEINQKKQGRKNL